MLGEHSWDRLEEGLNVEATGRTGRPELVKHNMLELQGFVHHFGLGFEGQSKPEVSAGHNVVSILLRICMD